MRAFALAMLYIWGYFHSNIRFYLAPKNSNLQFAGQLPHHYRKKNTFELIAHHEKVEAIARHQFAVYERTAHTKVSLTESNRRWPIMCLLAYVLAIALPSSFYEIMNGIRVNVTVLKYIMLKRLALPRTRANKNISTANCYYILSGALLFLHALHWLSSALRYYCSRPLSTHMITEQFSRNKCSRKLYCGAKLTRAICKCCAAIELYRAHGCTRN